MKTRVFAYLRMSGKDGHSVELIMLDETIGGYGMRLQVDQNQKNFVAPHYEAGRVILRGYSPGGHGIFNYDSETVTRIVFFMADVNEEDIDWHHVKQKAMQI